MLQKIWLGLYRSSFILNWDVGVCPYTQLFTETENQILTFRQVVFNGKKNLSFTSKNEQKITLLVKEPAEGSDSSKNQWASN